MCNLRPQLPMLAERRCHKSMRSRMRVEVTCAQQSHLLVNKTHHHKLPSTYGHAIAAHLRPIHIAAHGRHIRGRRRSRPLLNSAAASRRHTNVGVTHPFVQTSNRSLLACLPSVSNIPCSKSSLDINRRIAWTAKVKGYKEPKNKHAHACQNRCSSQQRTKRRFSATSRCCLYSHRVALECVKLHAYMR